MLAQLSSLREATPTIVRSVSSALLRLRDSQATALTLYSYGEASYGFAFPLDLSKVVKAFFS